MSEPEFELTDPTKAPDVHEPTLAELHEIEADIMALRQKLEGWDTTHPHTMCERAVAQANANGAAMLQWIRKAKDGRGKLLGTGNAKTREKVAE